MCLHTQNGFDFSSNNYFLICMTTNNIKSLKIFLKLKNPLNCFSYIKSKQIKIKHSFLFALALKWKNLIFRRQDKLYWHKGFLFYYQCKTSQISYSHNHVSTFECETNPRISFLELLLFGSDIISYLYKPVRICLLWVHSLVVYY